MLTGSEFYRVDAATEKALVPTCLNSGCELDDRICLDCLARVSSECNYAGCLDESA